MEDQTRGNSDSYFKGQGIHVSSTRSSFHAPPALDAVLGSSFLPISIALTVIFLGFAIVHALVQPPSIARILVPVAAGTALLSFGGALIVRCHSAPSHWTHPLGAALASVVLLNCFLPLYLLSEPIQTTNLMIFLVGVGCLFLSTSWLATIIVITWIGWLWVMWEAQPSPAWRHFGFGLFSSTVLSLIVHSVRVRILAHLEQLHFQDNSRQQELKEVRDDLEIRVQERTRELVSANATLRAEIKDRQRAEQALRESEEKYRDLVENLNDVIYARDVEGRITYISPVIESLGGYSVTEMMGRSMTDFVYPEDLPRLLAGAQRVLEGQREPGEFRAVTKSGALRWARSSSRPILQDGRVIGLQGVITDITERKQAEMQTKALLAVAEDISGMFDLQELLQRVQQRAAEILPCEVVGTFYWDANNEVFRLISQYGLPDALLLNATNLAFPIGEPFGGQVANGNTVVINDIAGQSQLLSGLFTAFHLTALVAVPLRVRERHLGSLVACTTTSGRTFDANQVELCQGIARQLAVAIESVDLYRQQQEEAEVAATLARVGQAMIASLNTPTMSDQLCQLTTEALNGHCSCTFLWQAETEAYKPVASWGLSEEQQAFVSVLSLPLEAVRGLLTHLHNHDFVEMDPVSVQSFVPPALLQQCGLATAIFLRLRRGQEVVGFQACGYQNIQEFTSRHRRIASGIAQLASLALANAKLLEELDRANRIKEDFVGTMSHELRTPLNVIIGYAQLMAEETFGPLTEEQHDILQRIGKNTRELLDLINATLDLSRLQNQQRLSLTIQEIHGTTLLTELEQEMRQLHRKPTVNLVWQTATNLPSLYTDTLKLKMVLKNLITNAMKFTDTGVITITATAQMDGVEFRVVDTGIGIPREALPIIFEPFRQVDSSSTRRHGGVGLGLYIVRQLVDLLGGQVNVESEVGRGSTFRVWIPTTPRGTEEHETVELQEAFLG
jgi:PAS domain S-box-containing protein